MAQEPPPYPPYPTVKQLQEPENFTHPPSMIQGTKIFPPRCPAKDCPNSVMYTLPSSPGLHPWIGTHCAHHAPIQSPTATLGTHQPFVSNDGAGM